MVSITRVLDVMKDYAKGNAVIFIFSFQIRNHISSFCKIKNRYSTSVFFGRQMFLFWPDSFLKEARRKIN